MGTSLKHLPFFISVLIGPLLLAPASAGAAPNRAVRGVTSIPFSTKGFDISWVEQSTGRYFLADGGNNQVDWFDATTTDPAQFFVKALGHGAFAGGGTSACKAFTNNAPRTCGGPTGVLTDDLGRVWAGDSPTATNSQSSVKVINTTPPYSVTVVNNGGHARADELSFDPQDHTILIANPEDGFLTWISSDTLQVEGKFYYSGNADGVTPTLNSHPEAGGLEQSTYDPSTHLFYQAVPGVTDSSGHLVQSGSIDVFKPVPVGQVGQLVDTIPVPGCTNGPAGLALVPNHTLIGACDNAGVVVQLRSGRTHVLIPNLGGGDEVWFNRGDLSAYFGIVSGSLGVADAVTGRFQQSLATAPGAHSVAAYEGNNHIFVPTTKGRILIFGSTPGALALPSASAFPGISGAASASFSVDFTSSAPGQGEVYFGSGPGCSGLVEVATQDMHPGTTQHSVDVTGNDLPGTVGDNGIQPGATYSFEVVTVSPSGMEVDSNGGKCYSVTIPTL